MNLKCICGRHDWKICLQSRDLLNVEMCCKCYKIRYKYYDLTNDGESGLWSYKIPDGYGLDTRTLVLIGEIIVYRENWSLHKSSEKGFRVK